MINTVQSAVVFVTMNPVKFGSEDLFVKINVGGLLFWGVLVFLFVTVVWCYD